MPAVPVADATAADAQRIARAERDWAEHNPPMSDPPDGGVLTLWNFPVGKADLAPEHVQAIEDFAKDALLQETRDHSQSDWVVLGHASVTGTEDSNQTLAQRRADNVAAVLRGLGLQKVRPEGTGSLPDPDGTDPQLLARNRRVTVYAKVDKYQPPPEQKKLPDRPKGIAPDTRVKINLQLRELLGRKVKITPNVIGELRVFLKDSKSDPVTAGVLTVGDPPALTEEFEKVVGEQVFRANLNLGEPEGQELPPIKISIQAEEWFLTPKVSYGTGVIYFNFKAVDARLLPVVDYNGEHVYMEFSGSIRFDIALLDSTAAKYPLSTTAPGPTVTAPTDAIKPKDTDPLVIAEAITDASKQASPLAQEDVRQMVLNLARRDGAACRVAWEALDDRVSRDQLKGAWHDLVGPEAEGAFVEGSDLVEGLLIDLDKEKKGAREDRKNSWKTKYGAPQGFRHVREGVFQDLKGYDEDQGDLDSLVHGL